MIIYLYIYIYNDPLIWIDCLHHDPLADYFMIVFLPDRTNILVGNMIGDVYISCSFRHTQIWRIKQNICNSGSCHDSRCQQYRMRQGAVHERISFSSLFGWSHHSLASFRCLAQMIKACIIFIHIWYDLTIPYNTSTSNYDAYSIPII